MGTFVFSRVHDMFTFFTNDIDAKYPINPYYWSEKIDSGTTCKEFSMEKFKENVKHEYDIFSADCDDEMMAELWDEIEHQVLSCDDNPIRAYDAAVDFEWISKDGSLKFDLCEFWEHDNNEYTHQYIWILYAIVGELGLMKELK